MVRVQVQILVRMAQVQKKDGAGSILRAKPAPLECVEGRNTVQVPFVFWNLRQISCDPRQLVWECAPNNMRRAPAECVGGRNVAQVPVVFWNLRQISRDLRQLV